MRRALRLIALLVAVLAPTAPPLDADDATPHSTQANLCARSTPSFESYLSGTPPPVEMTGCTAEQNCFCAPPVSCSGTTTCIVGSNYVECDGNRTYCCTGILCQPPQDCQSPDTFCDCRELGFSWSRCFDANC